jgi:hypothetical protein
MPHQAIIAELDQVNIIQALYLFQEALGKKASLRALPSLLIFPTRRKQNSAV